MAYVVPSPQVYEQLANAGGVLNSTPDLNTCIVGPANNVIKYDASTAGSLLVSKAATVSGIEDNSSVVSFPNPKPGQVVDPTTVKLYANNAKVRTHTSRFYGFSGENILDAAAAEGTCLYSGGSSISGINATVGEYITGDSVTISLGGNAGVINTTLKTFNPVTEIATISATPIALPAPTTCTGTVAAGQTTINVTNITGIANGTNLTIGSDKYTSVAAGSEVLAGSTILTLASVTDFGVGSIAKVTTIRNTTTNIARAAGAIGITLTSLTGIVANKTTLKFGTDTTVYTVTSVQPTYIVISPGLAVAAPANTAVTVTTAPTYTVTAVDEVGKTITINPGLTKDIVVGNTVTAVAPIYSVASSDPVNSNLVTLTAPLVRGVSAGTSVKINYLKCSMIRVRQANLNSDTGTLRVEPGDNVELTYVDPSNQHVSMFSTKVKNVTTTNGLTGLISSISTTDKLPSYIGKQVGSASTTLTVVGAIGATSITVASTSKILIGTKIALAGGTSEYVVINVVGSVLTLATPLTKTYASGTTVTAYASVTTSYGVGASVISVNDTTGVSIGDRIDFVDINTKIRTSYFIDTFTPTTISLTTPLTAAVGRGSYFTVDEQVKVSITKDMNNQLLPEADPLNSGLKNYTINTTTVPASAEINPGANLVYGSLVSGDIHVDYSAHRTDLASTILDFASVDDIVGTLGDITDANPLGLACLLALANTTTSIKAIAIGSNDLAGYVDAWGLSESIRMYAMVPLTQSQDILASLATHVTQWSTPENASWRVALVNTNIPDEVTVGLYSSAYQNLNSGNNTINDASNILDSSNSTFITDGVTPGDIVNVTYNGVVDRYTVQEVVTNTQLLIDGTHANEAGFSFYVTRPMSKLQKAEYIADVSTTFKNNRVIHVQPDTVGININGTLKYLPGYYLCAALGGLTCGLPVQQGFTNIGVAGIADLKFSNFYFTRSQLSTISAAGTFLYVQEAEGTIPYCRHQLTTDLSDLNYREFSLVKNWDFLAYAYYDTVKSFIGTWNITPDTLSVIKGSINAQSEMLKAKKLPKIGAPLQDANISKLEQNALNKDTVDCVLNIAMNDPLNYLNLYLTV